MHSDSGNSRALEFRSGTKSAVPVWGRSNFVCNGLNQIKPGSIAAPVRVVINGTPSNTVTVAVR